MPGPTDDDVLNKIAEWCDLNGWDNLDSEAFNDWLKEQGIDRNTLIIGKCSMPDWA